MTTNRFAHARTCVVVCAIASALSSTLAQDTGVSAENPDAAERWDAHWIAHPTASPLTYGVYHFRRAVALGEVPGSLPARVSGDNRYVLYVNGREVARGPERGDLLHWRYRAVDLASYLRAGDNEIRATVWNFAEHRPAAQVTLATGFVLDADDGGFDTDGRWEVVRDERYGPTAPSEEMLGTYVVVGAGERVDFTLPDPLDVPLGTSAGGWVPAGEGPLAKGYGVGTDGGRFLVPSSLPAMGLHPSAGGVVRRWTGLGADGPPPREVAAARGDDASEGEVASGGGTPASEYRLRAPGHNVLYAAEVLRRGYPQLRLRTSGPATLVVTYAESLVDSSGVKGHRDRMLGKRIAGLTDTVVLDATSGAVTFQPLWYRTWRYVEVRYLSGSGVVVVPGSLPYLDNAFPFGEAAALATGDSTLDALHAVGLRTARLCAHETYVDCPYYEQLQYAGDTRVQALVSLYAFGEDRLLRRALHDFDHSRLAEGLTQSRYPSARTQFIPPFSLLWVAMLHDFHMYRDDPALVREMLPGTRAVMDWHLDRLDERGLLGATKWWNFVDWAEEWPWDNEARVGGVPPLDSSGGGSTVLSLQLAYALPLAADLEEAHGDSLAGRRYRAAAARIRGAVNGLCFDADRGLYSDLPGGGGYSQHANAMAVLAGAVDGADAAALVRRVIDDSTLVQATFYYKFYVFEALARAGLGDLYLGQLGPWEEMLALGLSTFAEKPEPTRSDCHAWSASPSVHLASIVAGVRPGSAGFRTVRLAPALGTLDSLSAEVPHPAGTIRVAYRRRGADVVARAELPAGVTGTLEWRGDRYPLTAGANEWVLGRR